MADAQQGDPHVEYLGEVVQGLRLKAGFRRQHDLATAIGFSVHQSDISEIETGTRVLAPERRVVEKLVTVLAPLPTTEKARLTDALLRAYLLGDSGHDVATQVIAKPHTTWLFERMINAALPPESIDLDTLNQRWIGIAGRIAGAGISLIHGAHIIALCPDISKGTWALPELLSDLRKLQDERGAIDWTMSKNFSAWALGFCLNNAQSRIALTLESCTGEWLKAVDGSVQLASPDKTPDSILKMYLDQLLATKQVAGEPLKSVQRLCDAVRQYPTPQLAVMAINALADPLERERRLSRDSVTLQTLEEIFNRLLATPEQQAECAGMIYGRTRNIEHGQTGTLRKDFGYPLEWLVTVAATIWTGTFWRHALTACIEHKR